MYRIILASQSPRRKEIMTQMGIPYEAVDIHVVEEVDEKVNNTPSKLVKALAMVKARAAADRLKNEPDDLVIIGADTMVFHHGQAMGKPKDREDAAAMLMSLSDDIHEVYTGVCIIIRKRNGVHMNNHADEISFSVGTKVAVGSLTMEQIEDYIDTGEPFDKAGAYAIQGGFGIYIREIQGDYYNIVGFPIAKIYEKLRDYGINIKKLK